MSYSHFDITATLSQPIAMASTFNRFGQDNLFGQPMAYGKLMKQSSKLKCLTVKLFRCIFKLTF